jgi:hypothetical protein
MVRRSRGATADQPRQRSLRWAPARELGEAIAAGGDPAQIVERARELVDALRGLELWEHGPGWLRPIPMVALIYSLVLLALVQKTGSTADRASAPAVAVGSGCAGRVTVPRADQVAGSRAARRSQWPAGRLGRAAREGAAHLVGGRRATIGDILSSMQSTPPRGWYRDPRSRYRLRWWDGRAWTGRTGPDPKWSTTLLWAGLAIPAWLGAALLSVGSALAISETPQPDQARWSCS